MPQRIGDQRTRGRTAARPHRDAVLARVADEIPDDQEVSGKLHLLNDGEFPRQTLLVFRQTVLQAALGIERAQGFQPAGESLPAHMFEIAVEGEAGGHVKVRETDC